MKRYSILPCLLYILAVNFFIISAKAQAVNVNDSLAVVDLYNSTDGPNWTNHSNWLTTNPLSTWYGLTVNGTRVTSLALSDNNLSGSIPASIGNLVQLTFLNLGGNQLRGAIPNEISNLVNLQYLWLNYNQLSGSIPASISELIKLEQLSFGSNQLSGVIPAEMGKLDNLQFLELGNNHLSGTIPAEMSKLNNLTYLDLSYNQLSGAIPNALGYLEYIGNLFLNNNQLSGTIPASFRKLNHLWRLDLSFNQLHQDENIHFSNNSTLHEGWVNNNLFTFNGLESIAKNYPISYAPQANISIHQHGNTLSVYAGGTLSNNTYNWQQVGAEGSTVIKADSTFTPTHSGRYYVKVTNKIARLLTLHSDTIDFTLSPLKQNNTLIAKAVQPAIIIKHMQVYPNPAKEMVQVQVKGTAMIAISNADGKILLTKRISNSDVINVSSLAPGTYYLQNKASGETQKIVVVH